jgi:hypothetical protein
MEELGSLLENLQSQSQQLETTITALAQSFTAAAAEAQPKVEQPVVAEEPTPPPEAIDTSKPKRRRGGMFGNELTLDD